MVAPTRRRVLAWVIDAVLMFPLFVIGWVALVFALATRGQTPGKALLGLRLLTPAGEPLPARRFVVRELVLKHLAGILTFELSTTLGSVQLLWDRKRGSGLGHPPEWNSRRVTSMAPKPCRQSSSSSRCR